MIKSDPVGVAVRSRLSHEWLVSVTVQLPKEKYGSDLARSPTDIVCLF